MPRASSQHADHSDMEYSMNPPGPIPQHLNKLLHVPPFSFLFYGSFWSFILLVASPLAGLVLIVMTLWKLARYVVLLPFGLADGRKIRPDAVGKDGKKNELAVLITGCDSGFGCDLTFELGRKGFVVFAGCLSKEAMNQFEGLSNIIPLKMDVTDEKEVENAVETVMNWLVEGPVQHADRHFHALVNNAGIGTGGRIDWLDLKPYRQNMEVNYFGMVRVTQACLPILKSQAISRSYNNGRIINMVSMAGMFATGDFGPYVGSKFAAEGFSSGLRHEMEAFGIQVATVNPSFHTSALTNSMGPQVLERWSNLDSNLKDQYGEAFFEQSFHNKVELPRSVMWDAVNVRDRLVYCIETTAIPAQVPVGLDAKFSILLLRHLPVWLQDTIISRVVESRKVKPAVMVK
mmetsp:Transcript_6657/g.14620  ORF Transcript_6657/g.14620 Transcript_6657/m.14620 type:complete len:403 (+) Transcript_6657:113-1321(+)